MVSSPPRRDLDRLPKAHLHLHFTGSLDVATLARLAASENLELPDHLLDTEALSVPATTRGWFRFQRSYDVARLAVASEEALRTVVRAAAANDLREGVRRLELQLDPSSYAAAVGGLDSALEIVLDEAAMVSATSAIEVAIVVAASRIRNPLQAETLARLAARYAGDGPGHVVGFGLSNDEHAGVTEDWEHAFAIARRAGLPAVPHGGELAGPEHVRRIMAALQPARIGHGVRASEDPALLDTIASEGICLEVCPVSNVHLGVYDTVAEVPLRTLVAAGIPVALGADDPLLFFSRLTEQYRLARDVFGFSDDELADLARASLRSSFAPSEAVAVWLAEVDDWLAEDPASPATDDARA